MSSFFGFSTGSSSGEGASGGGENEQGSWWNTIIQKAKETVRLNISILILN